MDWTRVLRKVETIGERLFSREGVFRVYTFKVTYHTEGGFGEMLVSVRADSSVEAYRDVRNAFIGRVLPIGVELVDDTIV